MPPSSPAPASSAQRPRTWPWLLGLGAGAFAYRLLVLHSLRGHASLQALGLDAQFYHEWATRLAQGQTSHPQPYFMGPLYPYTLGVLYTLAGPSVALARWVQLAAGAAAAAAVFEVGRRAFGLVAGTIAGLALALYGYGAFLELHLGMEPLLAWLVLVLTACALAGLVRRSGPLLLAAGVSTGLLACGRGSFLVLLLVLVPAPWLWYGTAAGARRTALIHAACLIGGCLVALAPVAAHNLRAGGGIAMLTTNAGINYYIGNQDAATGAFWEPPGIDFFQPGATEDGGSVALASRRVGRTLSPAEASRYWLAQGLRWNAAHPERTAALWARKSWLLLSGYETPQIENFDQGMRASAPLRLSPVRYGWLVALGCLGVVLGWRDDRRVRLLALLLAAGALGVLPFFITARYRFPLVAVWCLLAGVGVQRLVALRRRGRAAVLAAAMFTVAGALLLQALRPAGIQAAARAMPLYNAGVLAMQRGDFAGAAVQFEQALALQPEHVESQANLAFCWLQTRRVGAALQLLAQMSERDPENLRVLQLLAHGHLLQGEDAAAEQVLERMRQLVPGDAWTLLQLGDIADRRGDAGRARELWQRALPSADPELARALQQRLTAGAGTSDP